MSSIGPTCLYFEEKKYITYLLSPFRACSHISPTPRNGDAIVFCSLPASRPGPNATREPSSLVPRTFSTSLLVVPASCFRQGSGAWLLLEYYVGGILLIWPIHLHPIFVTSNEMGSIPVHSWRVYIFTTMQYQSM